MSTQQNETKGRKARNATRHKLVKEHERFRNKERIDLRDIANKVVKQYPNIAIEDIHIPNLLKNKRFLRRIIEQGWRLLNQLLTYRSEKTKDRVIQVLP